MTELFQQLSEKMTPEQQDAMAKWLLHGGLEELKQFQGDEILEDMKSTIGRINQTMERIRKIKEETL